MFRLLRLLLRPLLPLEKSNNAPTATTTATVDLEWVNAKGKPIGSKRSRTRRLERRQAREMAILAQRVERIAQRSARQ